MVSVCLASDALLQHLPSYLGFSYRGPGVSLHGCSSKAQPLLLQTLFFFFFGKKSMFTFCLFLAALALCWGAHGLFSSCFSSSIHASPHRLSSLMLRLFFLLLLTVIYPTITVFLYWHSVQSWTCTRFSVNIHWYEREVLLCCICRNNSSVIFSYLLITCGR